MKKIMSKIIFLLIATIFVVAVFVNPVLVKASATDNTNNIEFQNFFTKDHPKAKGINISIEYPSHWESAEGERPNVVQKFSGDASDGITRSVLILIKDAPKILSLFSAEDIANELFSGDTLKEAIPPGGIYISGKSTKYDGQPGALIIFSIDLEQAGVTMKLYTLQHIFFYNGKIISVQCGVGGLGLTQEELYQEFEEYIPLFGQIGNSIVIHDKWDKSNDIETSIMESLFGSLWWLMIVISFVLTWGIGLLPPIIIRYVIIKKPLYRKWSICLVIIFLIINIIIFTALDSQSKTHAALYLVAITSYYILRKGNKK